MTEEHEAPSLAEPLDVLPGDQTIGDRTAGDRTRPYGEANAFPGPDEDDDSGELVTEQEELIDTPDELGGVGGEQPGGAG